MDYMSIERVTRVRGSFGLYVVVLSLCALLVGCSPVGDLWAATDENGKVTFVVCEEVTASEIRIGISGDDDLAWVTTGSHEFAARDSFAYGQDPSGLNTTDGPIAVDLNDTLVVSVKSESSAEDDAGSIRGVFELDQLRDDSWIAADGARRDTPCSE